MKTENFTENLIEFQTELFTLALRLTEDKEEAHDLVQDTSLKALDNQTRFSLETNFRGWIYTIMRNIFINNYRRVTREQNYYAESEKMQLLKSKSDMNSDSYDLNEMYRALESLPDETREPFTMYASGFMYKEISEALNIPIGTIKSRIFAAKQRLQFILKDYR